MIMGKGRGMYTTSLLLPREAPAAPAQPDRMCLEQELHRLNKPNSVGTAWLARWTIRAFKGDQVEMERCQIHNKKLRRGESGQRSDRLIITMAALAGHNPLIGFLGFIV